MKINLTKLLSIMAALCIAAMAFASCSEKSSEPEKNQSQSETQNKDKKEPDAQKPQGAADDKNNEGKEAPKSGSSSTEEEIPQKYGNAEVYEKNDKSYAKTDDGKEVELSNENMEKLLEEYSKVQGSGSQEEKDLLNQIQVILEAPRE